MTTQPNLAKSSVQNWSRAYPKKRIIYFPLLPGQLLLYFFKMLFQLFRMEGWMAYASHANSYGLRKQAVAEFNSLLGVRCK